MDLEIIKEKGKSFGARTSGNNINYTHYSLTEQLFEKEHFDPNATILEPACGHGAMVHVLQKRFRNLHYYDIKPNIVNHQGNFYHEPNKYDYLITNPPYGKEADKFVIKAKEVVRHKFAMLLRTNYLSGQYRHDSGIFDGLKNVNIFTRMPDLTAPIRKDGKYPTAMIVYAWLIWEIGYKGKPNIDWIDNQKYVLKKRDI